MIRHSEIDDGYVSVTSAERQHLPSGWVRVRVGACGLCGTDLHLLHGMRLPDGASYPVRPGHEVAGEVIEASDPEGELLFGSRVVLHPLNPCGHCPDCLGGEEQRCPTARILGIHEPGGLADEVAWPARRVVPIGSLAIEEAAILADAGATAHRAVRAAELSSGSKVCILGAGGVGTQVAAIARALYPGVQVVGVVGSPSSAARLRGLVDHVEVAVTGSARRLRAQDWSFDAVIDFSSQADAPHEGMRMLRNGGRLILGSVTSDPVSLGPGVLIQSREIVVKGSYSSTIADLEAVVDLASRGAIDLSGSVTHRFPLDDLNDAFATMAARPPGMVRVVVTP